MSLVGLIKCAVVREPDPTEYEKQVKAHIEAGMRLSSSGYWPPIETPGYRNAGFWWAILVIDG